MIRIAILMSGLVALTFLGLEAQAAGPTDPQIAAIVVTANQVDINAGKLANSRSTNKEVQAFARKMVSDHSGVNKSAKALVSELNVKPEDNATSESLKESGEANIGRLQELQGSDFDRAYIENEVTYHQTVLDALDDTLIPSATNADLKALLVKVRPAFEDHLEHAKRLQASLAK
jgi:putative membrane protein